LKLLERMYTRLASPGLVEIIRSHSLSISWIVEAGCHNGSDSLNLLKINDEVVIHAFEPDSVAFDSAMKNVSSSRFKLSQFALMDRDGMARIIPLNSTFGTGSSIVKFGEPGEFENVDRTDLIQCRRLDGLDISSSQGRGAFWIDVEGAEIELVKGAIETLKKVDVIQIEVVLHDMSSTRRATWRQLNQMIRGSGFELCYAPVHPGYFGDCIYVRTSCLSFHSKLKAIYLNFIMTILHCWVYPILRKPLTI
jgi:FkbM family methyltransferase